MRSSLIASSLAALAVAALLLSASDSGAANPTGYWKLSLRIDFTSTGTVTNSRCYPDPSQRTPSPVSGSATQKLTVRTTRPANVEFHEAPNGVPVAGETLYARGWRGKVSETRSGDVANGGEPLGCNGNDLPRKTDCGTKSLTSGLYVNPFGGIHRWKGFTVEPQESPAERWTYCGLTEAQFALGDPLEVNVLAKPAKLTGRAPKLVFRGSQTFKDQASEETTKSTATGKVTWTVTLRRSGIYGR